MQQSDEVGTHMTFSTSVNARLTGRWTGSNVEFNCDFDPPWDKSKNGDVTLPTGSGRHDFKFHVHDPDHIGLQFIAGQAVLDANESGTCPDALSGIATSQIIDVSSNGQLARFTDLNDGAEREIGYSLNLTSKHGNCRFDPVISNGGGGHD